MFSNIIRSILLVFLIALMGRSYATNGCDVTEKDDVVVKTDSSTINNDDNVLKGTETKIEPVTESTKTANNTIFKEDDEIEEDTTSNSALAFNFIYYIIEKFKFQVE